MSGDKTDEVGEQSVEGVEGVIPAGDQGQGGGNEQAEIEQVSAAVGGFGRWQLRNILLCCLFCVPTAWHVLIMTFMNAKVSNTCARPEALKDMDLEKWKVISGQENSTCQIKDLDWAQWTDTGVDELSTEVPMVDCTAWEYDKSVFTATIIGEFDLVCSSEYLISTAQTLYFFGMILGVFTFGVAADIFGRKPIMIFLLINMFISGVVTSQMPTYATFVTGRVVNAFFVIGIFETQFTYVIELVSGKWTTIIGMGMEFCWVTGWLLLAVIAYLVRDWRVLMLVTSIPTCSSIAMIWLIPESPRWLLANGKIKQAEDVIKAGAALNNKKLPENWHLKPVQIEKSHKTNILDLFKTKNMRGKALILYFAFFVNAGVYFGLSMNIGDLGGDVYLNFVVSGLMEIPAYCLAMVVMLRYGRRFPFALSMVMAGVALLSIMLVPRGVFYRDWPAIVLAMLGKSCITFSFGALFVYASELLPTEIRTSGVGSASFVGRIGGMLAPWIGQLSSVHPYLPVIIFGIQALLAGLVALMLPETFGNPLPYTIEESEKLEMAVIALPWNKKKTKVEGIAA